MAQNHMLNSTHKKRIEAEKNRDKNRKALYKLMNINENFNYSYNLFHTGRGIFSCKKPPAVQSYFKIYGGEHICPPCEIVTSSFSTRKYMLKSLNPC